MVDNIINYNGTNIPPPKSQKKKKNTKKIQNKQDNNIYRYGSTC